MRLPLFSIYSGMALTTADDNSEPATMGGATPRGPALFGENQADRVETPVAARPARAIKPP
jgi:hypothetical protein